MADSTRKLVFTTQGSCAWLALRKSPQLAGIITDGVQSCFALGVIGEAGIGLAHIDAVLTAPPSRPSSTILARWKASSTIKNIAFTKLKYWNSSMINSYSVYRWTNKKLSSPPSVESDWCDTTTTPGAGHRALPTSIIPTTCYQHCQQVLLPHWRRTRRRPALRRNELYSAPWTHPRLHN